MEETYLDRKVQTWIEWKRHTCIGWKRHVKSEGKAIPLQAWTGPAGSRKLRFPDNGTGWW